MDKLQFLVLIFIKLLSLLTLVASASSPLIVLCEIEIRIYEKIGKLEF